MRSVASLLARPFDPIGLLFPFILQARLIMKECHLLDMKWSDTPTTRTATVGGRDGWANCSIWETCTSLDKSHSWMDPLL